jgi:hypothetical protein
LYSIPADTTYYLKYPKKYTCLGQRLAATPGPSHPGVPPRYSIITEVDRKEHDVVMIYNLCPINGDHIEQFSFPGRDDPNHQLQEYFISAMKDFIWNAQTGEKPLHSVITVGWWCMIWPVKRGHTGVPVFLQEKGKVMEIFNITDDDDHGKIYGRLKLVRDSHAVFEKWASGTSRGGVMEGK